MWRTLSTVEKLDEHSQIFKFFYINILNILKQRRFMTFLVRKGLFFFSWRRFFHPAQNELQPGGPVFSRIWLKFRILPTTIFLTTKS